MESKILDFPEAMSIAQKIVPHISQAEIENDFPKSIFQTLSDKLPPEEFMEVVTTLLDKSVPEILELHNLKFVLEVSNACVANQLPALCSLLRERV